MATEIVEFAAFEGSKENLQPLKGGRNPLKILETLQLKAEKPSVEQAVLQEQRAQCEAAVRDYTGDDPLVPWLDYLTWTQQTFGAGGSRAQLLPLLDACTKTFQGEERYRNDVRYLKVWITYADTCADPSETFAFLDANKIGESLAMFYEAWALAHEDRHRYEQADKTLLLGIHRKAQPTARLEEALKRMQARAARRHNEEMAKKQNPFESDAPGASAAARPALATLGSRPQPLAPRTAGSTTSSSTAASGAAPKRGQAGSGQGRQAGISVFHDDGAAPVFADDESGAESKWTNFGSMTERNKENVGVATAWNTGPLKSAAAKPTKKERKAAAPEPVAFAVFMDEECQQEIEQKAEAERLAQEQATALYLRQQQEGELVAGGEIAAGDAGLVVLGEDQQQQPAIAEAAAEGAAAAVEEDAMLMLGGEPAGAADDLDGVPEAGSLMFAAPAAAADTDASAAASDLVTGDGS